MRAVSPASYLEEGMSHRDLDFVYGSSKRIGDVTYFIPLDGQQRLTTLFLLHLVSSTDYTRSGSL